MSSPIDWLLDSDPAIPWQAIRDLTNAPAGHGGWRLEWERSRGANRDVTMARLRGQDYLRDRGLFRRRSAGEAIVDRKSAGADWTRFAFPVWWRYDVLRGLEHLWRARALPEARAVDALRIVESRRDADGRWRLGVVHPGQMLIDLGEHPGTASRWTTLRALRVSRAAEWRPHHRDRSSVE